VVAPVLAVTVAPGDRWLLAFTLAALLVLAGGAWFRREARERGSRDREAEPAIRGLRRRAGVLLAIGPVVGLLVAPGAGGHAVVAAVGAVGLAVFGMVTERRRDHARQIALAALLASLLAVVGGVQFEPTGVEFFDVLLAVGFIWVVTIAVDGLGNADGLVPGIGVVSGIGVLALAAFGDHFGPANVAAGLVGACVAYLAYNVRPASLFAGRAGRLAVGYTLGVTALSVHPTAPDPGSLLVPLLLVAVPLLDAGIVAVDRLRRRRPLFAGRRDHMVHRFLALDATQTDAVMLMVGVQFAITVLAVFAGRDVLSLYLVVPASLFALGLLGGSAMRASMDRMAPIGFSRRTVGIAVVVVILIGLAVAPVILSVPDVAEVMQDGRRAAERGLVAARRGDAANAEFAFREASGHFTEAADRMGRFTLAPARAVPGVAPNVRAAKTLAEVGRDLSHAGEVVAATVVPENLEVVDGQLNIDEIKRIQPALAQASGVLDDALARVHDVAKEPYLLEPVREAVREVERQLGRSAGEARRTAAAAKLAPALFGGDGTRKYLLVVQNNAESRATGGFIGSYGTLTAEDGKVSVSKLLRTGTWNAAIAAAEEVELDAPNGYLRRYGQFQPELTLQNVNLSPDFPTVARVLMSLTQDAGVGPVDGVMAVDPEGLAALLQLTGPVTVTDWPDPVSADNVVDVTLRDAYARFANTPERADFLGDVAEVVVDEATTGTLGKPARIAQVLGTASHEGHILLAFKRPAEQRLVEQLDTAGAAPGRGKADLVHVTTQNVSANKLDYYLRRDIDYRVQITPGAAGEPAQADALFSMKMSNTAPAEGLPKVVAGPFEGQPGRFRAGELLSFVSVYSPLTLEAASIDGRPLELTPAARELGANVYSTYVDLAAGQERTLEFRFSGTATVRGDGWYTIDVGRQPLLEADQTRISVTVPPGWRIDKATGGLIRVLPQRAARTSQQARPARYRVHLVPEGTDVWSRLEAGS
jgi:UDP-N-acetylmuramyl pentapeptide phosphotransferase/UDP-N-acetylglucosamine-1-phosphate transferase